MERKILTRLGLAVSLAVTMGPLAACDSIVVPSGGDTGASAATATPTSAGAGETTVPGESTTNQHISKHDCVNASAGDVITGDVNINGQWTTDQDSSTGQIIIMQQDGNVCAPYGADVQKGIMNQSDGGWATIRRDSQDMKDSGCGNGCTTVLVNYWPSGNSVDP